MNHNQYEEVKDSLKKLSGVLVIDALNEEDMEKIALSNTLSVALACLDIGGEMVHELMKSLSPLSEKIAQAILAGAPGTERLTAVSTDDLFDREGKVNTEAIYNRDKQYTKIDINEVLKDSGIHIQPDQIN